MAPIPKPDDTHVRRSLAETFAGLCAAQGRRCADIETLAGMGVSMLRAMIAAARRRGWRGRR